MRWAALCLLAGACGGGASGRTATAVRIEPAPRPDPGRAEVVVAPDLTVGEDVLERALEQNADTVRPPPTVFRRIEVSAKTLPESARTEREGGFTIQLPSRAPIVTPTVYGDLVVVSGGFRSREMYAFKTTSGELEWGLSLGDDGPSTAACEDGVCVFNTESCTLFAVEAETGELLWSHYLGDPLMSAPAIAGGLVFASYPAHGGGTWAPEEDRPRPDGVSHALGAFDLHSGELRWNRWIDAEVISAPVAIVDAVYASTFAGTVYKIDQRSGEILAARAARATSAPSLIDGRLYFAHRADEDHENEAYESILWMKPEGGGESARRPARYLRRDFQSQTQYDFDSTTLDAANGFANGAPASANATVAASLVGRASVHGLQEYQGSWVLGTHGHNFVSMGDALVSYDDRGRERWSVPLPGDLDRQGGALAPPPAAAGDHMVVATLAGFVLIVDPESGRVERRLEVDAPLRTQPAVHDGWIYLGTADGKLVGIDTGDATLTGWSTWAANSARTGIAASR